MDNLRRLHAAILNTLQMALPELKTCAEHPIEEEKPVQKRLSIACPALFVTQTECETLPSDGTSRLRLKTTWQAVSVVEGFNATSRQQQARDLILKVSEVIFESRFGVRNVEPAQIERLKPYPIEEELKLLAGSWVLTWTHDLIVSMTEESLIF